MLPRSVELLSWNLDMFFHAYFSACLFLSRLYHKSFRHVQKESVLRATYMVLFIVKIGVFSGS